MILYVRKRDGRLKKFSKDKIHNAILSAFKNVYTEINKHQIEAITQGVVTLSFSKECEIIFDNKNGDIIQVVNVETLQDIVERELIKHNLNEVAKEYSSYRKERTEIRETKSDLMKVIKKINVETDRDE